MRKAKPHKERLLHKKGMRRGALGQYRGHAERQLCYQYICAKGLKSSAYTVLTWQDLLEPLAEEVTSGPSSKF